jgi:hypothetical protein
MGGTTAAFRCRCITFINNRLHNAKSTAEQLNCRFQAERLSQRLHALLYAYRPEAEGHPSQ